MKLRNSVSVFAVFVMLVGVLALAVPAMAQGGPGDGARPEISDECQAALEALRETGERPTAETFPAACEGQVPAPPSAECQAALEALHEAGEPFDAENLPAECEGEELPARPFGSRNGHGRGGFGQAPAGEGFERPEISDECHTALEALRESGTQLDPENLPAACEGLELPQNPGGGFGGPRGGHGPGFGPAGAPPADAPQT